MLDRLPEVKGRYTSDAPLGEKGWFRCGGKAEVLYKPLNFEDLIHFLKNCPRDIPIHVFGALSNTIIRDGGLPGVTIRLGRAFSTIKIDGNFVHAGALALDTNVASIAAENGVGGLEFLSGIPGTVGGAVKMNAGCYGTETKDVLKSVKILNRDGSIELYKATDLEMTYRHTNLKNDQIVIEVIFEGIFEDATTVKNRISDIKEKREQSQPIKEKTGGSTFANPSPTDLDKAGLSSDTKVWQLIERAGGRGLEVGGAKMSVKHCNFMINNDKATSQDLEDLGEAIRKKVADESGIDLRWEIKRLGNYN